MVSDKRSNILGQIDDKSYCSCLVATDVPFSYSKLCRFSNKPLHSGALLAQKHGGSSPVHAVSEASFSCMRAHQIRTCTWSMKFITRPQI